MPAARTFHVADLNAQGELLLQADYTYELLERIPLSWDMLVTCATSIWRSPEEFESSLPAPGPAKLALRWRNCARGAGILTIRHGDQVASLSLLASGIEPDGDSLTCSALQQHLVRELHDTGNEPAFSLLELPQRPLLATILILPPPTEPARVTAAIADRCFAAAYFRYLGLV